MIKTLSRLAIGAVVAITLSACSSSGTHIESDLYIKGAPDWVNEGSQAINNDDGRLIHGVGMSAPIGDLSLQTSVADNRARAEVARILSTSIDARSGDYSTASGGVTSNLVDREINSKTQVALKGVKIISNWRNLDTGDIYVAAEMDLSQLQNAIKRASDLNAESKMNFIKESNRKFDRYIRDNK